jgi:hypothetical protein
VLLQIAAAFGLRVLLAGSTAPEPRVFVDAGAAVAADGLETIRWEAVPADAKELELLLELDGGRARLRITDELDPRDGAYRWRVPNISARSARIVLRLNRLGREFEIRPSAPFAIGSSDAGARAAVALREGEIWLTQDADEGDCEPPAPAPLLAGSPVTISASPGEVAAALPPAPGGVAPARQAAAPEREGIVRAAPNPSPPVFGLAPLFVPRRI